MAEDGGLYGNERRPRSALVDNKRISEFLKSGFWAPATKSGQNRCSNTPGNQLKRRLRGSNAHSGQAMKPRLNCAADKGRKKIVSKISEVGG